MREESDRLKTGKILYMSIVYINMSSNNFFDMQSIIGTFALMESHGPCYDDECNNVDMDHKTLTLCEEITLIGSAAEG